MQIIEKSALGVRSAFLRLEKDGTRLAFVLLPMIHVGTEAFYQTAGQRLAACDVVLAEGLRSKRAALLTLAYRIVRRIRDLDLVTQEEGLDLTPVRGRIIWADMPGPVFDDRWRAMPLGLRIQLALLIPLYAAWLLVFGTRAVLARHVALDDLPSADDEVLDEDASGAPLDWLLVDERDQCLIDRVEELQAADHPHEQTVGVVYGARHMRAVIAFLVRRLKYRVVRAEWVTVFEL